MIQKSLKTKTTTTNTNNNMNENKTKYHLKEEEFFYGNYSI